MSVHRHKKTRKTQNSESQNQHDKMWVAMDWQVRRTWKVVGLPPWYPLMFGY